VLWDPSPGPTHLRALQGAARSFGVQVQILEVRKTGRHRRAFSAFRARPQLSLSYFANDLCAERTTRQTRAKASAASDIHGRQFAEAGGAVAYAPSRLGHERSAVLVAKISVAPNRLSFRWSGHKGPARVNLKTAKALA